MPTMLERQFQTEVIKRLKELFPECIILKNDPNYIQGFPDLTVLWCDKWAILECKVNRFASHQPNQDYYISKGNKMSFAAFVYPENIDDVLDSLERYFNNYFA